MNNKFKKNSRKLWIGLSIYKRMLQTSERNFEGILNKRKVPAEIDSMVLVLQTYLKIIKLN